ncbi:AAA family ATPase [Aerosakkonema sp. BLCC-F183]|uniref:AAA family ATPase n=1 Tax=Aerosakkonema sp. BLCC-F183 TaxID=3342834 RepID=UPI0035BA3D5A
MTSPNVPRNAYTDAPEQHPNLIIGSLQLLWWIIFHPSAFRNHLNHIDPDLEPFSSVDILMREKRWQKLALWRLLIQVNLILPVLASLLIGLVLWGLGIPTERVAWGVVSGLVFGLGWGVVFGLAWGVAFDVAFSLAFRFRKEFRLGWGVVSGVVFGLVSSLASGLAFGLVFGLASGFCWGLESAALYRFLWGWEWVLVSSWKWGLTWGLAWGLALGLASGLTSSLAWGLTWGVVITINLWLPVMLYPFLTVKNFLLYWLDKLGISNQPHFLRWHSAFWDEWQRLPLHGLDKHVLLVLERNAEEGKAALDYLRISRQRWAAQAVQIELDARKLEYRRDVVAISNAHDSLKFGELNSPISSLLSSFSYISQDVDAAINQKSAYNQRLVFSAVAEKLNGLIRELTRSSNKYSVRFLSIAIHWYKIVTNHIQELAETVELRQENDNPYLIGVPLTEQQEIFTGRTDIGTRIEQLILDRRRPPLLLYGQRRMGKTSLLNNLGRLLPNSIIPMFVDLQGPVSSASDYAGFLYNIARAMIVSAKRQSAVTLPPLTRETLAVDPFTSFDEWLDKVEQTLDQNIALLSLDEFEALDDAISKGRFDEQDVLGMLRHLIQHRPRFKLLLAGSHTIEEFQRWASYLINVQVLHISYLKEPEARQLIERPVKDFTLRYEPDAVERVLQLTRCHPFLVQLLCAEIIYLKNEQDPSVRRLAKLADVEAAVPAALSSGSFFFADIQNNQVGAGLADNPLSQINHTSTKPALTDGLAVLRFIAAQGEGATVSREVLSHQFGDNLDNILELLLRRELIEEIGEGYRFQVELIRCWFVRK